MGHDGFHFIVQGQDCTITGKQNTPHYVCVNPQSYCGRTSGTSTKRSVSLTENAWDCRTKRSASSSTSRKWPRRARWQVSTGISHKGSVASRVEGESCLLPPAVCRLAMQGRTSPSPLDIAPTKEVSPFMNNRHHWTAIALVSFVAELKKKPEQESYQVFELLFNAWSEHGCRWTSACRRYRLLKLILGPWKHASLHGEHLPFGLLIESRSIAHFLRILQQRNT
jgi:hypothetical protein